MTEHSLCYITYGLLWRFEVSYENEYIQDLGESPMADFYRDCDSEPVGYVT
jgi:hypothetical protein